MSKFRKLTFRPFQVRYAWIENGIIRTGKTVMDGLDELSARRKFRKQNPHVMPITPADNLKDPSFKVILRTYLQDSRLTAAA